MYYTFEQEKALKQLLETISKERNSTHAQFIAEHNLLEGATMNSWEMTLHEDIFAVLELEGKDLTNKQLAAVTRHAANIDMSYYNEAISDIISMVEDGDLT